MRCGRRISQVMRRVVPAALLIVIAVALGTAVEDSSAERAAKVGRLAAFDSCGEYLGYVRPQAARLVGPYGLGGGPVFETARGIPAPVAATALPSTPQAGVDYSGTNVQEEGVDEPDLVKTDGKTLYVAANGRISAFDVTGRDPRLLDSIRVENAWSAQLLLHGDRLLVLTQGGYVWPTAPRRRAHRRAVPGLDLDDLGDRRLAAEGAPAGRHAQARRESRRRPARRRDGPHRRVVLRPAGAPVRAAGVPDDRGAGGRAAAQPGRRGIVEARALAAPVPAEADAHGACRRAPARPVPPDPSAGRVLRPRPAHRAHRRPREGSAAGQQRVDHD